MKKILSFSLILALVIGMLPTTTLATVHSSSPSTLSDTSFIRDVSNITNKYQTGSYFSSITMKVGKDDMMVDGQKKESIASAKKNGELMLPILDIAKSLNVPISVNKQTRELVINGKELNKASSVASPQLKEVNPNSNIENAYKNTYTLPNISQTTSIVNTIKSPPDTAVEISKNGTQVYPMSDGSRLVKSPLVNEEQTENALGLDVNVDGDNIIITKPYQTKGLIVQTNGETLSSTYGAIDSAYDGKGMYLLQYSTEAATQKAEYAIRSLSYVKSVHPNGIVHTTSITNEWGQTRVQANRYKPIAQAAGGTTIVAVLDTGIEVDHELLLGRTVPGYDFVDNDSTPEDVLGHGTHVSGIIANNTPNNVKIMPIKVLNDKGSGYLITIKLGIEYAISHGASVINMSLGGTSYADSDPILEGISKAVDAGVTVVVAAGNDNISTDHVTPAKSDKAITVAASTQDDTHAEFSNYGKAVDITAPGVYIQSSIPDNNYSSMSGTSMATPFVASAVAMQKLIHPTYTPAKLKTAVESATVDCGTPGRDTVFGAGVLDYGILLGDNVPARTISSNLKTIKFQNDSITQQSQDFNPYIYPENATNKSYTVTSNDPSVAVFQNGKIVAKKAGTATITFTLANKAASTTCVIKVEKTEKWIDYYAKSYAGGNGSKGSPYLISNSAQLAKLAYDTRIGGKLFENTYFKLTADIDLSGKQWASIMYAYPHNGGILIHPFQGNFDGANHKIKNLTIQQPREGVSDDIIYDYAGLFGMSMTGYIKNLAVTDAMIDVKNGGAILSGESLGDGQQIDNCYTSGYSSSSGFINYLYRSSVSNSFSNADSNHAGFIRSISGGIVSNCYASGNVMYGDDNTGGFAGTYGPSFYTDTTALIVNSFATNTNASGIGFLSYKRELDMYPSVSISKCYYNIDNPFGISTDENQGKTDLTAKNSSFFKSKSNYTTTANWNSKYAWDFKNKWAIDPGVNNGFPYLKSLGAPTNKTPDKRTNSWIDYAANSYAGGKGTKASPYLISTPQQLARVAKIHRYGGGKNIYYKLTANIDLSGYDWLPIGYGKTVDSSITSNPSYTCYTEPNNINRAFFRGNILGNGRTISNLNIDVSGDVVGFVSVLAGGNIKDLSFVNAKVSGKDMVGTIASINCNSAKISNCKVSGEVSANNNAGGLVGYNDFDSELNSNTANTTVIGTRYLGGLTSVNLGYINTSFSTSVLSESHDMGNLVFANHGTISNSYAKSRLTDGTFIDGIGNILNSGRIINSYSFGTTPRFYSDSRGNTREHGVDMTDNQMKNKNTFDGWDFNNIWGMDSKKNDGYPYLKLPVSIPDTVLPTTHWLDYKANSFEGGNGSAKSPYLIKTAEQLAYMVYGVYHEIFPDGSSYKLVSDIDLSGRLWLGPYGLLNTVNLFFDGNGHIIDNMIMNHGFGLFGNFSLNTKSVVKNVGITNIKGYGTSSVSMVNYGNIINCYSTGSIRDVNRLGAGGLVLENQGLIEYCYSTCDISSYYNASGLTGNYGQGRIRNSYFRGNIYSTNSGYGITMNSSNCYTTGIIIGSGQPIYYEDTIYSSYYDKDISHVDSPSGKTTTEMKTPSTYSKWDFNTIWGINATINNGYPYLKYNYNGLPSYTISYNVNGGTGSITPQIGQYASRLTLSNGGTITKPANLLTGWSTSPSGQGKLYSPGAAFTLPQNDVILYAQWAVACTITFDANGGTSVKSITKSHSSTIDNAPVTTKAGYTFAGWYTSKNGQTKVSFPYKVTGNKTVYAHWNAIIPSTPTSVKAISVNYKTIKISWGKAPNATEYKIYRATSSKAPYTLIGTVSTLTFSDASLTTGKKYYYKVMAYNKSSNKNGNYSSVVYATPVPATVILSSAKKSSSTSVKLGYGKISGANGYEVWYKTSSSPYTLAGTSTTTSYTKKKLKVKKVYYFKVRAYRKVGTKKVYGSYSVVKSVRL